MAKADVMFFQRLFAIFYALFKKASAFLQRVGLFVQGAMFVWVNWSPAFIKLRLVETCVL